MNNSKEHLTSILKAAQMGQYGIRSVMAHSVRPEFHQALKSQLQEYDEIEQEACRIAKQLNWKLPSLHPSIRLMTEMAARVQLLSKNAESKIAGMMVQGNTRGMIVSIKNRNGCTTENQMVQNLSEKLLAHERANIQQMLAFL